MPLARLADASENDLAAVGVALRDVLSATSAYLDAGARAELERLVRTFPS